MNHRHPHLARHLIVLAAFVSLPLAAHAEDVNLAFYPFNGTSPASTDTDPDSTATNFNRTGGTGPVVLPNAGGVVISPSAVSEEAARVTSPIYLRFSVSPVAGHELDLGSLSFRAAAGPAGNGGFSVDYSIGTSGTFESLLSATAFIPRVDSNVAAYDAISIDLSAAEFQNVSETIHFRIYAWNASTSNNIKGIFDDVALTGSTALATASAVPEPASIVLMAGGLAAIGALRRRRMAARSSGR